MIRTKNIYLWCLVLAVAMASLANAQVKVLKLITADVGESGGRLGGVSDPLEAGDIIGIHIQVGHNVYPDPNIPDSMDGYLVQDVDLALSVSGAGCLSYGEGAGTSFPPDELNWPFTVVDCDMPSIVGSALSNFIGRGQLVTNQILFESDGLGDVTLDLSLNEGTNSYSPYKTEENEPYPGDGPLPDGYYNMAESDLMDITIYCEQGLDYDMDGVIDSLDLCPNSDANFPVDDNGCLDTDDDNVADVNDVCPNTDPCYVDDVDVWGCSDEDEDGILDPNDDCWYTPPDTWVDANGCPMPDADGDGVPDACDLCPDTDPCDTVDAYGCPDSDDDGVSDPCDLCPDTCSGDTVDSDGCPTDTSFCSQLTGVTATAWGDYNNDGYADMIGGADVYTNDGDLTFTKTTPFGGLNAVSLGDWNNDGYLDVFSNYGDPKLFTNDGDETWTDDAALFAAADDPTNCSASTWGDWNGDGYLDTYSTGWYSGNMEGVIYLSNDGLGWHQSWQSAAVHGKGIMGCDYDEDGDMDIYVSNYWLDAGFLWQNNDFDGNNPGLTDVRSDSGADDGPGHTQGSTWADFDNDGDFDLFICNFAHAYNPDARFVRNNGASSWNFTNLGLCDVTQIEPISSSTTGDFDNDGYLDLVITTSAGYSPPNTIMVYTNDGDFTFTDATSSVGLGSLGPDDVAAFGDFNNDGWLDLIVADTLYRNSGGSNHWLKVKLVGGDNNNGLVNKAALGAQVRINSYTGLGTLTRQVQGNTGCFGMQNDQVLHFGLGADPCDTYDLEIDWPNGYSETIEDVNIDEDIEIEMSSLPGCNFTAASQSDSEDCGTMTITAQLSETSDENVTIPFSLGGTATEGAGADYTITSSPITITSGNTTANITITVNDDPCSESDETVIVTMGTLIGANKTSPSVHTATITDNDEDCGDTMHIEAAVCVEISCGTQSRKNGRATITIYDDCGDPVENALVDGTFSGDFDESYDDVSTDENGQAVFTTTGCVKQPSWSFTVDDVTHGTVTYDSNDDLTTGCSD